MKAVNITHTVYIEIPVEVTLYIEGAYSATRTDPAYPGTVELSDWDSKEVLEAVTKELDKIDWDTEIKENIEPDFDEYDGSYLDTQHP